MAESPHDHDTAGLPTTFETLGPLPVAPPPPAAFLCAVRRRRRQRRAAGAGAAFGLLALLAIPAYLTLSQHGQPPGQIAAKSPVPPDPQPPLAAASRDDFIPTRAALLGLNPQLDESSLVLPVSRSAGEREPELRLTTAWDEQAIARLLRN